MVTWISAQASLGVAEQDVPQLLAELRGSGSVTLDPGVELDVPQLLAELIAAGLMTLGPTPRTLMAWQRIKL